ncbi:hypothetical protein B0H14DRAFT_2718827 [Mycena olivaceomarginata]|nr:hypothetical protein B0H14DRAFT_2945105 [Mycena olivaceomarginata]KAJ7874068.1 hypothetical protein B0H14DRAFT_2718827 [Mycena olivaceomarginata]
MQDSDDELSATSEEEVLTPAEKGRRTRALKAAQEQAENKKLSAETAGGREAKKKALQRKIWDTSKDSTANTGRKRSASGTAEQPKRVKKAKGQSQPEQDDMDVDSEPVQKPSKKAPKKISQIKNSHEDKGNGKTIAARKRQYLPDVIQSSDDDSSAPQEHASIKSKSTASSAARKKSQPVGTAETAIKARSKLKKKVVSDDDGNNSLGQSDGEEDEQSDAQSQSEPEDAPVLDIELEGAQIIELQHQSVAPGPKEFFQSDDDDQPKPRHRRQASSSSVGSMPPDTDFDFDLEERHENDEDDEDNKNDEAERDEEEEEEEEEVEVPVKPKMSAQQLKYEDEKPAIRSSKVIQSSQVKKAKADPTAESDWHPTARIVFPATGGNIKLLDQNGTLKAVTRLVIDLHLYEIAFKAGYEGTVSRSAASRRLIRKSAKKRPDGSHIGERARRDLGFCAHLAPIIFARGGNVRTALRNSAISKVATHYELNKPGTTPSQVRSIVKQLLDQQRYILPYAQAPTPRAATSANPDATLAGPRQADPTSVTPENTSPNPQDTSTNPQDNAGAKNMQKPTNAAKVNKSFITTLPFHAPAIIDMIHDVWWSTAKALGFKHVKDLISHRIDRPGEIVLPDAMICLAGANIWAALLAYETGRYVPAKDFSQDRLENTYTSLLEVLNKQRNGLSAKFFNNTMHELYLKVSHSAVVADTSSSANNVICLPIDSD